MPVRSVDRESILAGESQSDIVMYKGNVKKLKATIIRIEKQRRKKKKQKLDRESKITQKG